MFSYLLGHGYNIFMSVLITSLLTDVMQGSIVALITALIVIILFIVPTSERIHYSDHRFYWLKYF